jgi:oxysterol-binding protein 1
MPPPPVPTSPHVSAASGHVSNVAAEKLYHFIARPRSRCIDFAARDQATGTTILHEAAKRKDLAVIKLAVTKGADILGRDKKGKLPVDSAKDERIKSVLRQGVSFMSCLAEMATDDTPTAASSEGRALRAAASDPSAGAAPLLGQPPAMRGYLSKWTNMARGYRTRWFVLDNGELVSSPFISPRTKLTSPFAGVLSYYRTQEDEGKASRGSINMSVANVVAPGVDKLKFEVNNKLGKSFPSFWLKGNRELYSS